jgi:transposase
MSQNRKRIDSALKAKVALEAIRCEKTTAQIVSEYEVHKGQISNWKTKVIDALPSIFEDKRSRESRDKNADKQRDELFLQIGKMKVEIEFLKKKSKQLAL